MDPAVLGPADWQRLHTLLLGLWFLVALVVPAAFSFLLAHAILPSLMLAGQLPRGFQRYRIALYVVAAEAALVALFLLLRLARLAHVVIQDIYPRWWI